MKRVFFYSLSMAALLWTALPAQAGDNTADAAQESDSLRMEHLGEVVVSSVRVGRNAPFAVSNLSRAKLKEHAAGGQEIPFLLQLTPSVVATSDAGLGLGTGYLRIRGSADSRINITLDGVALNDNEDQCVFWANMNGYAAMLSDIQIQRGVGTSTNGSGSFGATVALKSREASDKPTLEATVSYGNYNTLVLNTYASTGLLFKHLIVDGSFNMGNSRGYIDCTPSRQGSWYAGATWLGKQFVVKYKHFANFEHCAQAWDGIANDDEAWLQGYHRYNGLNEYYTQDADGKITGFNPYPYQTTDNYWQNRNMLSGVWSVNPYLNTSLTLHYTRGRGYYDNYKPQTKYSKFGLESPDGGKKADLLRRKGLVNDTYGANWNIDYQKNALSLNGGLSFSAFAGNHYGILTDVNGVYAAAGKQDYFDQHKNYYDSDASKYDLSGFVKANYDLTDWLSLFGDLQLRYVDYRTNGRNDKFVWSDALNAYENQMLDVHEQFLFFNPKAGVHFHLNGHSAYVSYARSHREPGRNNYTDNGNSPYPTFESLNDIEAGYMYQHEVFSLGANFYAMLYHNQLVQTGELSDIGEALTTNIPKSYRLGVELTGGVQICRWLDIQVNATLSRNKAIDYTEYVANWITGDYDAVHYDKTDLAFSPNVMANGMINFHWAGLRATWTTSFTGRQHLDNTGSLERSLDPYTVSNARVSYSWFNLAFLKELTVGARVNNVLNALYIPNAWVYTAIADDQGNRYNQIGYFPMGGVQALGTLTLKF